MDNSRGRMRTNYFKVTDVDKFTTILSKCKLEDDEQIQLFNKDIDGEKLYAFGCSSNVEGYCYEEIDEPNFDDFISDLQTIIAPGHSIIMMEIKYRLLCYIYSAAFVITADSVDTLDLTQLATEKAAEVLGNSEYNPKLIC